MPQSARQRSSLPRSSAIGAPAILKTRRFGYDGKGQVKMRDKTDAASAWRQIGEQPAILEALVPFEREVSIVAARSRDGRIECFDLIENEHRDHILKLSRVPANVSAAVADEARRIAEAIATAFDYVGVLAVEMFVVAEGGRQALLVNEIAPRVHNSGHWTIDGATVSQFEQHVRAVAGWPLAKPLRHGRIEMTNLIGAEVEDYARWLTVPGASVHLYGKGAAAPRPQDGSRDAGFSDRPGVTAPWGGVDPERRLATRSAWAGKAAARSPNSDGRSPPAGGLRRLILLQAQLIGSPRVALWRGSAGSGTSRTIQEPQQRNDACRFSSVIITSIRPSKR